MDKDGYVWDEVLTVGQTETIKCVISQSGMEVITPDSKAYIWHKGVYVRNLLYEEQRKPRIAGIVKMHWGKSDE